MSEEFMVDDGDPASAVRDATEGHGQDDAPPHGMVRPMLDDDQAARKRLRAEVLGDDAGTFTAWHRLGVTDTAECVDRGRQVALDTYEVIQAELARLRSERDAIAEEIRQMVEAEALWQPIVNRLMHGPATRKREDGDDEGADADVPGTG